MSAAASKPRLPRVFVVRHGETEWSVSGQHTGLTDIPLTQKGEDILRELGGRIVGKGKVLDPAHIQHVFVSPRQRAQKTFSLLFEDRGVDAPSHSIEDGIREWDYGVCEGKKTAEIRKELGEDWDIWTMGCPEGESPDQMRDRCDAMIKKVVDLADAHHGKEETAGSHGDIVIISHGHFSRCFMTRWCQLEISQGRIFVADTGALHKLGFQHRNFDERSLLGLNLYSVEE
ncbi:histidine phosphatase superfamily [Rhodotorula diobovata]|uniref:Histidine phosphatase superfamily n=1 Tax=Rhodotorula diobovata TaxID=5288 RepID=A0A5C5G3L2_9BASI|nr:histidine phosphatase superfamily [Rhodotorula diobovata]